MSLPFEATIRSRAIMSSFLDKYSLAQLNHIPDSMNNNIFWNIAHVAATMQLLVYSLSGSQWRISKDIVKGYRNGTKPERLYTQADIESVREVLISSAEQCQIDYENSYFGEMQEYETKTGFVIRTVEEAIAFNLYHEGLHMGHILTMARYVKHV